MRLAAGRSCLVLPKGAREDWAQQPSGLVTVQRGARTQVADTPELGTERLPDSVLDGRLQQRRVLVLDVDPRCFFHQARGRGGRRHTPCGGALVDKSGDVARQPHGEPGGLAEEALSSARAHLEPRFQ